MKYVVQYAEGFGREKYLLPMKQQIPELEIIEDIDKCYLPDKDMKSAMWAYIRSIDFTEPFVRLEDDAILCHNFKNRAEKLIAKDPNCIHQFFSLRDSDYEAGSRYVAGAKFMTTVCIYIPAGMGHDIVEFYFNEWKNSKRGLENPTGYDILIADYLKCKKLKYFVDVPCLVQHAVEKSAINPKRSSKRQTRRFIDDVSYC